MYTSANGTTSQVTGNPVVTAVSKKTGQFWSEKVKGGSAAFAGLYPGKYKLVANGYGIWFPKTGAVKGDTVKSGQTRFGKFTYTKRGGWVKGNLIDDNGTETFPLEKPFSSAQGAKITLYGASGSVIATSFANNDGTFTVSGQLATQSGVTLVVTPGSDSAGYMRGEGYCQYASTQLDGVSITVSQQTSVGTIVVPRVPDQQDPACMSEPPA